MDLLSEIEKRIDKLPKRKRKLAIFLAQQWHEVPLISIVDIAKKAGVSTATVTRFARELNFNGFQDFKNSLKEEIREKISPVEKFRLVKEDLKGKKSLLKVAEQDIKNINKLISTIDEETFAKAVYEIGNAKKVYTFGIGISSIFSRMMAYLLNQIEKEAHSLGVGDAPVEEKITSINQNDLLIISSFPPYSLYTLEIARLAHDLGVKIIGITDNKFSPISNFSKLILVVPTENILYTNSVSAFSVLINSIVTEIAWNKKESLAEIVQQKDRILKKFYY
ncbi:MAG: MurR/RpiR family transcriptional regulator [Candidatus Aminicenantia bacterium]